uniref:Uncharacterized protein n=1 Tax=Fagus sylvatica TaxID=28930 RepID=A0A2N9I6W2_FAGSY
MPRGVDDEFACWSGKMGNSESGAIWKAVPHCLMWCLWHERNSQTFSGEEQSVPALKYSFLQTLYEWLKASNLISAYYLAEMHDNWRPMALVVLDFGSILVRDWNSFCRIFKFDIRDGTEVKFWHEYSGVVVVLQICISRALWYYPALGMLQSQT